MVRTVAVLSFVFSAAVVVACGDSLDRNANTRDRKITDADGKVLPDFENIDVTAREELPDPFKPVGRAGDDQIKALCARAGAMNASNPNFNAVTNAFCKEGKRPSSITELQAQLNLSFQNSTNTGTNGSNGNPGFAFLSHSTSLVTRNVSSINPRAFVFSAPQGQPTRLKGFTVMSFTRGEPFVEVAAEQLNGGKTTFYVIKFTPKCGEDCAPSEILTPAVESNWQQVTVYDDEDLKNTIVDCRSCHQSAGPNSPMMLRMQEMEDPWTHWFRSDRPGGLALLQDYARAHGTAESYAGIPGALIEKSDGRAIEDFVKGQGFVNQPNQFNSKQIELEVTATNAQQPLVNTEPGQSATWESIFKASMTGQFIPVPYHDVKVTDPTKLQKGTLSYQRFAAGQTNDMLDIRRVFLDTALGEIAIRSKDGASGKEILVQTCAQCHNPNLDPTLTRAKFDVTKISVMSRKEKDEAIKRLKMSPKEVEHMPPAMMRSLDDKARELAIKELEK